MPAGLDTLPTDTMPLTSKDSVDRMLSTLSMWRMILCSHTATAGADGQHNSYSHSKGIYMMIGCDWKSDVLSSFEGMVSAGIQSQLDQWGQDCKKGLTYPAKGDLWRWHENNETSYWWARRPFCCENDLTPISPNLFKCCQQQRV